MLPLLYTWFFVFVFFPFFFNISRTSFEQRGSISVYGVGSLIGGMFEAFGQTFLQRGAKKVHVTASNNIYY